MVKLLLELFSGTHSVSKVAEPLGYEVVSVDRDMEATHQCDIMDWDYKQYPPKHFDVIWASPPCTEYSRALTTRPRDIDYANTIVQKTLDILEYFEPRYWMIENPQSGLLKEQVQMYGLPFKDIDYCKYGMPYRKRTRIWNNVFTWIPRGLCMKDCGNIVGNRHAATAQRGPSGKRETWADQPRFSMHELYRVPEDLIREIFMSMTFD
jgi:C-5 cytosine-specific DNA methylase